MESRLPHWSDTDRAPSPPRAASSVRAVLHDLVSWGTDLAVVLTRGCPEDRAAIARVRDYAHAWLRGDACDELAVDVHDVLTTAAAVMAQLDREIDRMTLDEDERDAVGAPASA